MHKARYNLLRLNIQISPVGPLLIKSGGFSTDPSLPDMQFVRTFKAGVGECLYIPGSSMKGVVRSFVEKALRTIDDHNSWKWACPTFEKKGEDQDPNCAQLMKSNPEKRSSSQGKEEDKIRLEADELEKMKVKKEGSKKELASWDIYRMSCGACKLFGSTLLQGRLSFTDLLPADGMKIETETRYGVAISRLSHAVAQGPFEMEVAVSGKFAGQVILENYEIWQMGVLATALESMNQGQLKVGFGKNRGFGQVRVNVNCASVEEIATGKDRTVLRGLGGFVKDEEREKYGLSEPYLLESLPKPTETIAAGFYEIRSYDTAGWKAISEKIIATL
jgi:CRISPR-associated protein Csm3